MFCPYCGSSVERLEGDCPSCSRSLAPAQAVAPNPGPLLGATVEQVQKVGRAFRSLLIWFAIEQLTAIFIQALPFGDHSSPGQNVMMGAIALGAVVLILVGLVMTLISVYRIASGMGSSTGILYVVGMLMPCVSLLVLLAVNSQAKTWLEARGVPVGLLGPSPKVLDALSETGGGGMSGTGFTRI